MGDGSRDLLEANLRRYGLSGCTILEGDAFELLRAGALGGRCVSVYYYDVAHDYESQCAALRLVESSLAESALLIVDDMDWTQVARATRAYRARQPRARLLIELAGKDRDQPWWWEGVQILRWRSVAQVARALMELGREMRVTFVDPETVEAKNVPRQNFCDAEIGLPKAEALARRYAAAWGLEIEVIVRAFEPKMIEAQIPPPS